MRTDFTDRRGGEQAGDPLPVRLDPRDPLGVDRAAGGGEHGQRGLDAEARQRIGRQGAGDQVDQLRRADRAADAGAGQTIGLGEGAQDDEIVAPRGLGGEARLVGEFEIGLVEDDDRLGQGVGDLAGRLRPATGLPVGLFGAQMKASFRFGSSCTAARKASGSKSKSASRRVSITRAPCSRANWA